MSNLVASISLYGTREIGFGTISMVKDDRRTHADGYDPGGKMGHDSATMAVWAAVELVRGLRRGPRGDVAIHQDRRVPGGSMPHVAIVPLCDVPAFGDLKFETDGVIC